MTAPEHRDHDRPTASAPLSGSGPFPRTATTVLSALMVAIGVAIVVRTVAAGGSPLSIGLLLGVLFVAAGGGRLYLARRG